MDIPRGKRCAVYYGDRYGDLCRAFRVKGTSLKGAVISAGTHSKLLRRYIGQPVERGTKDRIVDHFEKLLNDETRARLEKMNLKIDDALLPATCHLTSDAIKAAEGLRPYRPDTILKCDRVGDEIVRRIRDGAYAVEKHVYPVARHIFNECEKRGELADNWQAPDDLIRREPEDFGSCYPIAYRHVDEVRVSQLPLRLVRPVHIGA